jgi:hypothetical protein
VPKCINTRLRKIEIFKIRITPNSLFYLFVAMIEAANDDENKRSEIGHGSHCGLPAVKTFRTAKRSELVCFFLKSTVKYFDTAKITAFCSLVCRSRLP